MQEMHKASHTLLDRDANCLPQRKSEEEDSKEETYVAVVSVNEQVLHVY